LAFTEVDSVYRLYFPVIRARCRRVLADGDEAQDLAQETFIRLWRADLDGREPKQIVAWIYRTCTHLAVDRLRQRAARPQDERRGEPQDERKRVDAQEHAPAPDSALATRQLLEKISRRLGRDDLELLIMRRLDEMTEPQIALVLGVADRTVRRRLSALDERLHRILAELNHGA